MCLAPLHGLPLTWRQKGLAGQRLTASSAKDGLRSFQLPLMGSLQGTVVRGLTGKGLRQGSSLLVLKVAWPIVGWASGLSAAAAGEQEAGPVAALPQLFGG